MEGFYTAETGTIDLYLVMRVVGLVTDPQREISLEAARRTVDPDTRVDDELLFQVFYQPDQLELAHDMNRRLGNLLALDDGFRQGCTFLQGLDWQALLTL